ncbi:hypothetical protein LSH36_84g09030 [Paralvinella palmiformis]|uniref:Cadherin domain-containing protein n=1 Tax=Paralvinella palmiformis TaxID=53620 RepID=A0AAD9NAS9_9ANNE|nr:hypothetical protein LSH36_84g09030 [Paralvinella palmiformis]
MGGAWLVTSLNPYCTAVSARQSKHKVPLSSCSFRCSRCRFSEPTSYPTGSNHSKGRSRPSSVRMSRKNYPWTSCHFILPVLIQFLLTFAQGQGQGKTNGGGLLPPVDDQVYFKIEEEKQAGTLVGTIPTLDGLTYIFSEELPEFTLDGTSGEIRTKVPIDRERLDADTFNLFVQSVPSARHLIEVHIQVVDINDNSPDFGQRSVEVVFSERDQPGTQAILDTAVDLDVGPNGVTTDYQIVSGNEQGRFRLALLKDTSIPLLYLENRVELDREERASYQLRISVHDGGSPPRYGYLQVNVTVRDFNDNQPVFDQSYYSTQLNETSPPGTSVIQVRATDRDIGPNGDITYHIISDDYNQFAIDALTGVLSTTKTLHCQHSCDPSAVASCRPNSCFVTVEAKDRGGLSGRAYVTINLMDENDHDPAIRFQYFSPGPYAILEESAQQDDIVAFVSVTDQDDNANGQSIVRIVKGNELGHFRLLTNNLPSNLLTVVGPIDREKVAKYNLTFEAQDLGTPPRRSTASLVIVVNDVNDHVPVFEQTPYRTELSELTPVGSFVASITALDNDTGVNAQITYTIVGGNALGWFHIDSQTGLVTTRAELDRETTGKVVLVIKAQDGGTEPFRVRTNLSISIWDENDEVPRFKENKYLVKLIEGATPGTEITTVTAVDGDEVFYPETYYTSVLENQPPATKVIQVHATDPDAAENGTVFYAITNGADQRFSINVVTGVISTRSALDREKKGVYKLTVTARDTGYRYAKVSAIVEVAVADVQDTPPVFTQTTYTYSMVEDDGRKPPIIGRTVGSVWATSKDENVNLKYDISGGDPGSKFTIDPNSGEISTAAGIDREHQAFFQLKVTAIGGKMFSVVDVNITVVDLNDNMPSFDNNVIEAYVVENWPVGHSIHVAKAEDPDADLSGLLSYSFAAGSSVIFEIDPDTAMITLGASLQYISETSFEVTVIAQDHGSPSLSSSQSVHIVMMDVNDHTPLFEKLSYEVSVSEAQPVNDRFFRVIAEDDDIGLNGEVSYHIVGGNENGQFGVFPDGVLYIAKVLDRETRDVYVLTIRALDAGVEPRSSLANITVRVLDANDNMPEFTNDTFHFYLQEGSEILTSVGIISAMDADTGLNAEISYRIEGEHKGFSLHPKTGILSSMVVFDREQLVKTFGSADISLMVFAMDTGSVSLQNKVQAFVHITDINDNKPQFLQPTYEATLMENIAVATPVLRVSAVDDDADKNAVVGYSILSGNEDSRFTINGSTGQISVAAVLDREAISEYLLIIMAQDHGVPLLNTTASVHIVVDDANDNVPIFVTDPEKIQILETAAVGGYVTTVSATDKDYANNAFLSYRIVDGNADTAFRIDANTGKLYLASALDFEKRNYYVLNISVHDAGNPELGSSRLLRVEVLDYNDNEPQFSANPIRRQIQEGVQVGTSVLKITATDPDYGMNGKVSYSIREQEPKGSHFKIDPDTGLIQTTAEIDREFAEEFLLHVVATDQAQPSSTRKSSEKLVTVAISDINDNPPKFVSMNAAAVMLGSQPDTFIMMVKAEDPDAGRNGEVVYEILSGDKQSFRIDPLTGRLYLKSTLSSQVLTYDLTLMARDRGVTDRLGAQSTISQLTVFTRSSSNAGPQFSQASYSGQVYENQAAGTSVISVSAGYGARPTADVEYYLTRITAGGKEQKRLFQVNPANGVLSTTGPLDREVGYNLYEAEIFAVDRSSSTPQTRKSMEQTFIPNNARRTTADAAAVVAAAVVTAVLLSKKC